MENSQSFESNYRFYPFLSLIYGKSARPYSLFIPEKKSLRHFLGWLTYDLYIKASKQMQLICSEMTD